jgi:hypothetical protein
LPTNKKKKKIRVVQKVIKKNKSKTPKKTHKKKKIDFGATAMTGAFFKDLIPAIT